MSALTDTEAEALGEDLRDGHLYPDEVADEAADLYGPLWADPYAVVWPRSGMPCSHTGPDSCDLCDGTAEAAREKARMRRRPTPKEAR